MFRYDCLQVLQPLLTDEIVTTSLTGVKWEWAQVSGQDRDGNLFIGSMGNATAVALGIALALPHRRVIALESDGSVLLDLPSLTVIGTYAPSNLTVIVFDNQLYSGSRISHPSATAHRTSLELMARGAGIEQAATVRELEEFEREARAAVEGSGPRYLVAKVEEDPRTRTWPKLTMDYIENKYRFMRYLERTEGRQILPTYL